MTTIRHLWLRFGTPRFSRCTYIILGLLLLISAFLMAVALVSPNYPWLSVTTLIPLFVAVRMLAPGQAAAAGTLWGTSLALFSGLFADSPVTLSVFSVVVLGVAPAAYAYAAARLTRRFGYNPLVLGLGWLLVELSLSPIGLRSGLLAGSQHEGLFMGTVGQSLGYLLVAYLVAFANGLILSATTDLRLPVDAVQRRWQILRACGSKLWLAIPELRSFAVLYPLQARAPPVSLLIERF